MAAIHIKVDKSINVEEKNNVLIFKQNGIILKEYPIDNHYAIIKRSSLGNFENSNNVILIGSKNMKIPSCLPKGYSNIELYRSGFYHITDLRNMFEEEEHKYRKNFIKKRELFYFDTSLIDRQDYFNFLDNLCYKNFTLPNSFWFFNDWRSYWGWDNIQGVIDQCEKFDLENHSEIITKSELLCIIYEWVYAHQLLQKRMPYNDDLKNLINISSSSLFMENWDYPAVDENGMYCRMNFFYGMVLDKILRLNETKIGPLYGIPVIHSSDSKVMKKIK